MPVEPGTHLGRYEIRSQLGEGGMGVVYRALDPNLGREVAIKVLPPEYSASAERLARFEQEARAAGALSHENVLTVYDTGTHEGAPYIVSELLEGEELRARLGRGPVPLRRALDYARQIAHGLAAAHGAGVVHRDLKPENVFVKADERVKILDFGIAKLVEAAPPAGDLTSAETRRLGTAPGVLIGTAAYMSPEQAAGARVDHRSDIFSFGCVLYEMLAGRRAFERGDWLDTLNAIRKEEPPEFETTDGRAAVPEAVERIVMRCLEKQPARRFQSAGDLAFALETLSGSATGSRTLSSDAAPQVPRAGWRGWLPWLVAGVAALLAVAAFALPFFRREETGAHTLRFPVALPDGAAVYFNVESHTMGVSPDGRFFAFVADAGGRRAVWVRPLDELTADPLEGTNGAESLFWSPDSRHIAFFADGKLKRVEVGGKSLQTVCSLAKSTVATGSWGRDGTIIFSEEKDGRIFSVSAAGGTPSLLLESKGHSRRWVHFLPDGRRFLFYKYDEGENNHGLYAGSLDSKEIRLVAALQPARVQYVGSGHLLYPREGSLVAQPFDEKSLRLTGEPVVVVERLPYFDKTGSAEFSASETGVLVHGGEPPARRLVWLDRSGREVEQAGESARVYRVRLSPDGQKASLAMDDPDANSGSDLWIQDLARNTRTRFVSGPTDDGEGVWSGDGRRLAYFSCCEDASSLHIKELGDAGKGQLPVKEQSWAGPIDWSRDGRFLLYWAGDDVWVLPTAGGGQPYLWMQTRPRVQEARISPDGRWVAFTSEETGRPEVYATRFDRPGEKWRVSTEGGFAPRWRGDGRELFYVSPDSRVMAVQIKPGERFEAGTPAPLFRGNGMASDYDVTADGQRFILATSAADAQNLPFAVVLNWAAYLKR